MTFAPAARVVHPEGEEASEESRRRESGARVAGVVRICSTSEVAAPTRQVSTGSLGTTSSGIAGERDQLNQLIRAHSGYVASLAYRLLGRDDEVDDVVQDVFVSFFRFYG